MSVTSADIPINFVIALNSEARPLIEHFGLEPEQQSGRLRAFARDHVRLIISGIGQTATATAVGYLGAMTAQEMPVWINVGVAGHPDAALGQGYLIDKLVDEATQRPQYPSVSFRSPLPSTTLRTVTSPQTDYPEDALYDMEGSSFFEAATKFSDIELVSLVKIVSDNRQHPVEKITKQLLYELVKTNLEAIVDVVDKVRILASKQDVVDDSFAKHWLSQRHASATQKLRFAGLIQRLNCLAPETDAEALLRNCSDARAAIALLEETVDAIQLKLP